jgi:hypothetical protein
MTLVDHSNIQNHNDHNQHHNDHNKHHQIGLLEAEKFITLNQNAPLERMTIVKHSDFTTVIINIDEVTLRDTGLIVITPNLSSYRPKEIIFGGITPNNLSRPQYQYLGDAFNNIFIDTVNFAAFNAKNLALVRINLAEFDYITGLYGQPKFATIKIRFY